MTLLHQDLTLGYRLSYLNASGKTACGLSVPAQVVFHIMCPANGFACPSTTSHNTKDSTPGCSAPGTHRLHYQGTELLPFRCSESVIKTASFRRLQNSKIWSSKIKKLTTTSASNALLLESPSYHPPTHKARQWWMGSHPYAQGTTGKLSSFSIASWAQEKANILLCPRDKAQTAIAPRPRRLWLSYHRHSSLVRAQPLHPSWAQQPWADHPFYSRQKTKTPHNAKPSLSSYSVTSVLQLSPITLK